MLRSLQKDPKLKTLMPVIVTVYYQISNLILNLEDAQQVQINAGLKKKTKFCRDRFKKLGCTKKEL